MPVEIKPVKRLLSDMIKSQTLENMLQISVFNNNEYNQYPQLKM